MASDETAHRERRGEVRGTGRRYGGEARQESTGGEVDTSARLRSGEKQAKRLGEMPPR